MAIEIEKQALQIVEQVADAKLDEQEALICELCAGNLPLQSAALAFWKSQQEVAEGSFLRDPTIGNVTPSMFEATQAAVRGNAQHDACSKDLRTV